MSGGVRCGGGGRNPVKIVLINTQYVETDKTSFKSVVQELTGKDSGNNKISPTKSRKGRPHSGMKIDESAGIEICRSNNSALTRDWSFKEFDRLMKEMPIVDELYNGLWANY